MVISVINAPLAMRQAQPQDGVFSPEMPGITGEDGMKHGPTCR